VLQEFIKCIQYSVTVFAENRSIFVRVNQRDPEVVMRRIVPPVHEQGGLMIQNF
jgi:hypothetical protein